MTSTNSPQTQIHPKYIYTSHNERNGNDDDDDDDDDDNNNNNTNSWRTNYLNPLKPELNRICYLLALLAHHFLHVSRIRVKSLTLR